MRSALILPFNRVDLSYAFTMSIFGDFSREPGANDLTHLRAGDRFAPQREQVGVVVFARIAGDVYGVAGSGAHAGHFVSGHCGTDPGAVDHYPDLGRTIRNRARYRVRKVRVVDGAF